MERDMEERDVEMGGRREDGETGTMLGTMFS
jgi:hypothetical protein